MVLHLLADSCLCLQSPPSPISAGRLLDGEHRGQGRSAQSTNDHLNMKLIKRESFFFHSILNLHSQLKIVEKALLAAIELMSCSSCSEDVFPCVGSVRVVGAATHNSLLD